VNFPQPMMPPLAQMGLVIEMPADWDPDATDYPCIELVWFADDKVANRGTGVSWVLQYARERIGQPFQNVGGAVPQHGLTDPLNASVIQSTGDTLWMAAPALMPQIPHELVQIVVQRVPAGAGVELPDVAHLLAARLWYQAKR
jgi:hypothetical protein